MVYFIYGPEPYIAEVKCQGIVKGAMVDTVHSFDHECVGLLETPSFWGRRVALLKLDTLGADDGLLKYLKKRFPQKNDLVITAKDYRQTKLFDLIRAKGELVACKKLEREKLMNYCLAAIAKLQCHITEAAMEALITRSGYLCDDDINLYKMNIYLKQLAFRTDKIDKKDVEALVPRYAGEKAFQLLSLIIKGDPQPMMGLAVRLLEAESSPIMINGLMLRNLRIAYKARLFPEMDDKGLAKAIGINSYELRFLDCVRGLPDNRIVALMGLLQKSSNEIKDGRISAEASFLRTICEMIGC